MGKLGIRSAVKTLWKIGNTKDRCFFIFLVFAGIVRAVAELIIPLVTACIISKLSGERAEILGIYFPENISLITLILICFFVLFGFSFISTGVRALTRLFASEMKTKMNVYAEKLLLEPRKNCDLGMTKGEASYIIKSSSEYVSSFIESGIIKIICPLMTTILAIVYISTVSPLSLLILMLSLLFMVVAVFLRAHYDGRVYKKLEEIGGDINNHVLNSIENLPFISYIKSSLHEIKISKDLNKSYFKTDKKRVLTYMVYWFCVYAIQFACAVSVVFLILKGNNTNAQIAATLIVVIPYLLKIFSQVENLGAVIGDCQRYGISISRVVLIETSPESLIKPILVKDVKNYTSVEKLPNEIDIQKIEIQNLNVNLGEFEKTYNCAFYKGKINCLMGLSGSGKTTLINCLLGLAEHKSGNIIINDAYQINNLFFENEKVSISFQGENFFDRSIEENVMYPLDELNDKAKSLIKTFNLQKLLDREKESGVDFKNVFSGGEKQRLSIIRCIAKQAQIYILDEPTNELDDKNVKKTITELKKLKTNAMIIVISHDKRILDIADEIVTL